MAKNTIEMAEVLAQIISSRDIVDLLNKHIKSASAKAVDLDFLRVEFISRSAAHELLKIKEDWKRKLLNKKEVNFTNLNKDVSAMFRVVAANKAAPKPRPTFIADRIDIAKLLNDAA